MDDEPDGGTPGSEAGWPVHRPLPLAMTDAELMVVLRARPSTFYRQKKRGDLARFALPNPIGRARWSGERVQAWLRGEHVFATRLFGAGRRRRQDFKTGEGF